MPCFVAFCRLTAFPASLRGPVERCALRRLASIFLLETGVADWDSTVWHSVGSGGLPGVGFGAVDASLSSPVTSWDAAIAERPLSLLASIITRLLSVTVWLPHAHHTIERPCRETKY